MPTWERKNNKIETESQNIPLDQIEKLKDIFPNIITEKGIDWENLKLDLGEEIDARPERYSFSWAGKRDAIRMLQVPSRATLKPSIDKSIEWENSKNIFIEGENLEVLKLLYKSYANRVKLIYLDPPYNTGKEFIYSDDFSDPLNLYLKITEQIDAEGNLLTSNPETGGRYHSLWLSMMYPRLFIARQLLRDDGVIFISVDDNEVYNLRCLMNEIFGEENFIATVIWQKVYAPKNTAKHFSEDHDYIVIYARHADKWRPEFLPRTEEADSRYSNPDNDPRGKWKSSDLTARNYYSKGLYEVTSPSGKKFKPPIGSYWRVSPEKFQELDGDNRISWGPSGNNMPALKRFSSEVRQGIIPQTLWKYEDVGHTQEGKKELLEFVKFEHTENVLNTVKPRRLIQKILQIATDYSSDDIVMDFFAGSAVTAHAVMQQNHSDQGLRTFIMVQLPEPLPKPETRLKTIADIGEERLKNAIEAIKTDNDGQQSLMGEHEMPEDLGFRVFYLAESNYRQWAGIEERDGEKYAEQMELFTDLLLPGWTPDDVVWEIVLKEGFSLSSIIEIVHHITSNQVWRITDSEKGQSFYICMDEIFQKESLLNLKLNKEDLLICRDSALNDEMAANLALQCRLKVL